MEESSNGKLEEAQAVEVLHDQENDLGKEDAQELKPQVESDRGIDFDGESEPVNDVEGSSSSSSSSSDDEAEADEKISPLVEENCGNLEEEKVVSDSNVESVEPLVSFSEDLGKDVENVQVEKSGNSADAVQLNSKETEEKMSRSVELNDGVSAVAREVVSNCFEEKTVLPSDETTEVSSEAAEYVEAKENEGAKQSSLSETNGTPAVPEVDSAPKGIEEKIDSSVSDNNGILPPAPSEEAKETEIPIASENSGESSCIPDSASNSKESANAPEVETRDTGEEGNKPEITETTENPPTISVTRRPLQLTSWKSCCGIFEVLRRSDR